MSPMSARRPPGAAQRSSSHRTAHSSRRRATPRRKPSAFMARPPASPSRHDGGDALDRSMAHEVDAVELVAESLAGGECALKVGLAEHISVDLANRDNGRVARFAADQCDLAKEIAGAEASHLVIGADHVDLALGNQEEF